MWKLYQSLAAIWMPVALAATGALVAVSRAIATILYWIAGIVFVGAQAVPAYALYGWNKKHVAAKKDHLVAFSMNFDRAAGMAAQVASRLEDGPSPKDVEDDYDARYRPLFLQYCEAAKRLRFRDQELEAAIARPATEKNLRDLSGRLTAFAKRMRASSSS
jgi:hypothetical protein